MLKLEPIWVLYMNPMQARCESQVAVAKASNPEALMRFKDGQKVETYRDGIWVKTFRKGGPLEWFNDFFDTVCVSEQLNKLPVVE